MSRLNILPTSIDQIDMIDIAKQASRIKRFTTEQRELFFYNIWRGLPKSCEAFGNALFKLVPSLYNSREFHSEAGLSYLDNHDENGQIIRVAIMNYLGRLYH